MKIILGITASVAAIKAYQLTKALSQISEVRIVITTHANYFINADRALIKKLNVPIYEDEDEWPTIQGRYEVSATILHIEMRRWADCFLIAPLDANTLAKISNGLCDNLLTSIVRAWDFQKPLFLCPAMNTFMWKNRLTIEQLKKIKQSGATIIEPIEKKLACNDIGMGAMAEPDNIVKIISNWMQERELTDR